MLMIDDFRQPRRPAKTKTSHQTTEPDLAIKQAPLVEPTDDDANLEPVDVALDPAPPNKKKRPAAIAWFKKLSRKQKILFFGGLGLVLLLLIGGGIWAYQASRPKPKPAPAPVAKKVEPPAPPPKPTTEASRLTGVQITPELNKRPVTGIMIENSPDARPQAGLIDAGVVYEAVAEGGITRFLALFLESQPEHIGPVRSARPYYVEWALNFDAAYAHVGGSPDGLADIKALGVKDLDQFANGGYYQRVSSRYAPHNVYTSMAKMDELKTKKGYTSSNFSGFERKAEAPSPTVAARTIDLAISGALYNVHYDYNQPTNSYNRLEGGRPHTDERSGTQLSPKVVVVLVVNQGLMADRIHTTYQTTGSGAMFVFQDGVMTKGTWHKPDRKAQYRFANEAGGPLQLNPGQTWITLVNNPGAVTAKP